MTLVVSVGIGEKTKFKNKERKERDRLNILLHGEKPDIRFYANGNGWIPPIPQNLNWKQKQRIITLAIQVLETELDTMERI